MFKKIHCQNRHHDRSASCLLGGCLEPCNHSKFFCVYIFMNVPLYLFLAMLLHALLDVNLYVLLDVFFYVLLDVSVFLLDVYDDYNL